MAYRTPLETRIAKKTTRAIVDFKLIGDGDRVMVGLSGGKDSWTLIQILDVLRQRAPIKFSLVAVNVALFLLWQPSGFRGSLDPGDERESALFLQEHAMIPCEVVQGEPLSGDLYATAATLYYLITGSFIYDQVAEGGDLIRTLLEESPVPIEDRRPDVPPGLADVMHRCLSRDPAARYPDANAMRLALRPFC